jgi:teichuronic acid exporter
MSLDSSEAADQQPKGDAANASTQPPRLHLDRSLAHSLAWRAVTDWSSQILTWIAFFVVVRVLSPADFGIAGMAVVLFTYLRILGEFGIPMTVVTLRDLSDRQLAELNTASVGFGLSCFAIACLLARPVALFFKTPEVAPVLIVSCITVASLGLRAVPEGLLERDLRIPLLSSLNMAGDLVSAIATLTMALLGLGYWALVLGNVLGFSVRSLIVVAFRPCRFAWPRLESIRHPLRFGWHVMVSVAALSAYSTLDNVTAGRVLGASALGFYSLAWNLANVPLEKVTSLVTTVVPTYLAAVQTDLPALRRYFRTLTEATALATFAPTVGVSLVAAEFVPLAFGHKWDAAIPALQVLSVYAAVRSVVALLEKVLTAVGKSRFRMWDQLWALGLMPCAFYAGSHWGITGIAWGWVVAYPLVAVPLYWKTFKTIEMRRIEYWRAVRPALEGSVVMVLAVAALKRLMPGGEPLLLRLVLEIATGAVTYVAAVLLLHRQRVMAYWDMVKLLRRGRKPVRPLEAESQS